MTRIMTLDIAGSPESWLERKRRIAETIRTERPDVVALQSVRHAETEDGGWDQASQIAVLVPEYREVYFEPALGEDERETEGCAILARGRILEAGALKLEPSRAGKRLLVHALLDTGSGRLHVFNMKFPETEGSADAGLSECLPLIESYGSARVIVGNLNAPPGSRVVRQLIERGWIDAWERLRPECPGHTYDAQKPSVRVDYVFADRSLHGLEEIETLEGHLADHLGLVASLNDG